MKPLINYEAGEPRKGMNYGALLAREGRYEEALREFLWCWTNGETVQRRPSRLSFLLLYWGKLADVYPPALAALQAAYKESEVRLLDEKSDAEGRFNAASDFVALEKSLKTASRVRDVLAQLRDRVSTAELNSLMIEFRPVLVAAKQYADVVATEIDLVRAATEQMNVCRAVFYLEPGIYFKMLAEYFETALGINDEVAGREIADVLLNEFQQNVEAYCSLIKSARRVNRADIAQEILARGLAALPEDEHGGLRDSANE